jgi:hypothetical protein
MEDAMKPTLTLKLSAVAFAVIWCGWILFLNDEFNTLVIIAICGFVVSYPWYRIMSWCFRMMRLLPNTGTSAAR